MLNGVYSNPTTIFFGKGMEARVGEEVRCHADRILLHYGEKHFKSSGLYEQVVASLKEAEVHYVELGDVKPNPRADLVYRGIDLCREHDLKFILAVGGGSVIDSAKAIAIGAPWDGDFFDFFLGKATPRKALKVAALLTLPGSGSESSPVTVITHEEKRLKLPCASPLMAPVFSILNPEWTFTVSEHQTACGIVDAIAHVLERYFSNTPFVETSDGICESLLRTLMKYAYLVKDAPRDYNIRAEIMWAAKLAHDSTAGFGRKHDWSTHSIAHELGALYNAVHGEAVGVVFPGWMKQVWRTNPRIFAKFAQMIFNLEADTGNPETVILLAIERFRRFLKDIGMPVSLQEMGIVEKTRFEEMARRCVMFMPSGTIGNFMRLSSGDIVKILEEVY